MKKLLCLLGGALFLTLVRAQQTGQTFISGKIYIDSRLPNVNLGKFIRYKDSTAKLSNFYNKIIILDFWFTHCTDCIAQFPLEDSLQRVFKNDIQIIPVAYESKEVITKFLNNWEKLHNMKLALPFIIGDTSLNRIFANAYFPHYVWIAQDRRVVAQTSQHFLSYESIKNLIERTSNIKQRLNKNRGILDSYPTIDPKDLYNYKSK